jgi:hypothetical protein
MTVKNGDCFWVMVLAVLFLSGCENQLMHDRFNQNGSIRNRFEMINVGRTDKDQVELALGKPVSSPSLDVWSYYLDGYTVTICFNDREIVRSKRWVDPLRGEVIVEP